MSALGLHVANATADFKSVPGYACAHARYARKLSRFSFPFTFLLAASSCDSSRKLLVHGMS